MTAPHNTAPTLPTRNQLIRRALTQLVIVGCAAAVLPYMPPVIIWFAVVLLVTWLLFWLTKALDEMFYYQPYYRRARLPGLRLLWLVTSQRKGVDIRPDLLRDLAGITWHALINGGPPERLILEASNLADLLEELHHINPKLVCEALNSQRIDGRPVLLSQEWRDVLEKIFNEHDVTQASA